MVLSKLPLLKLAVVKVDAPPGAMPPAPAIDVISVEPTSVEVPVAVAFTGVSKLTFQKQYQQQHIYGRATVPIAVSCLSVADTPVARTCASNVIADTPLNPTVTAGVSKDELPDAVVVDFHQDYHWTPFARLDKAVLNLEFPKPEDRSRKMDKEDPAAF